MSLTNFGAVRCTPYLRPPATRGKRQERNMVVIVELVVEGMALILLGGAAVSDQRKKATLSLGA